MALLRRLLFIFLPVILCAQPNSDSVKVNLDVLNSKDLDLNQILGDNLLTSASRVPVEKGDLPYTSFIITNEQIRQRGYNTLVDVLKDLPGVKVSQPGSAIHGETFLMRGLFGNYYVKILVDDLPMQPSATSGMPIGAQLPIQQAERIAVLYGPAAAMYGADAMGGVLNILTHEPQYSSADWQQESRLYGSYDSVDNGLVLSARTQGGKTGLSFAAGASYQDHSHRESGAGKHSHYNLSFIE